MLARHHPQYDAIIVGARAAGAATAMLLARAGLQVLVVDRGRYGVDTLSTHGLMRAGVLQLHRWGLLDRIVAAGTPPIRQSTVTLADRQHVIPVKPRHGVDALYAPRRTVLDPVLVDAAVDAGADVRFGVTVTGLQREPDGRVVGVAGYDVANRPFRAQADLVIGADGVRSRVADVVGAPLERVGSAAGAVIYGYWSGMPANGFEVAYVDRMAAGVIPTNDGQSCVFVSAAPTRLRPPRMEVLTEVLGAAAPSLAAAVASATPPGAVRSFPGRPGFVRRSWGNGWALVGDAGYWKDPISTHGLTDALRDAELLARAVAGSDGPVERQHALADYQSTRDRVGRDLFDVTERMASFQWNAAEIAELLVQLSAAMSAEVELLAGLDQLGPDLADLVA
jgi:2-polyprenyl-6-methoxyphenol hydroxylase-like FAD-dependent oxidoreductase